MSKLFKYIPLHFLGCLIFGILLQFYFQIWNFGFLKLFTIIVIISFLLIIIKKKIAITFLVAFLFFVLGISSVFIQNSKNYQNYFYSFKTNSSKVILRIEKVLKPGLYYQKYITKVIQVDDHKTIGEVLLNIQKDTIYNRLFVDDEILAQPVFKQLIPPLNPHQFDYKFYLAKQGIHHQIFLENNEFLKLENSRISLIGLSERFRNSIQKSLIKHQFKDDEFAVISALLLGQRQDISKELLTDYQKAGAIHILAVSGLHVGVILLILSFLFKPLENLRNGKFLKAFCIVLLLWMFAFIAGLSASVVRAVTMFTFVAIGQSFKQKNIVSFSLISSMFFLLIVKPMFLFDVGFQLSYLAVFGIVWVQPKLYNIYKPRFYIDKKVWQLFTVSVAAQVGILPLSMYYFHQFPGLFVLSNLVIIPFLGIILMGGILVIFLALLNILPTFLSSFYETIISLMNSFISWISKQEAFLLKEISISFLMMMAWYFCIFSLIFLLIKRKPKQLIYFLIAIFITQSIYFYETKLHIEKEEFIVFHKSRFSLIGKRIGATIQVQHDIDSIDVMKITALKPYLINEKITKIDTTSFKNFINFNQNKILLIDSLGVYNVNKLEKPIVILQYSPKINLERLIKTLQPNLIIADGSNYKSYINRWENSAKKQKTPFHYTGQNGAYILKK